MASVPVVAIEEALVAADVVEVSLQEVVEVSKTRPLARSESDLKMMRTRMKVCYL